MSPELQRRLKPCEHCRLRRIACHVGDSEDCCLHCQQRSLQCATTNKDRQRDSNDHSEIRSQLARFEAVLTAINKQTGQSASSQVSRSSTPVASTSHQTLDTAPQTESVEIHDLVGALTELCFRSDGVGSGPKVKLSNNELVAQARDILAQKDVDSISALPDSGFIFQPLPSNISTDDLIAALPPAEEVLWLLEGVYAQRWVRGLDGMMPPSWHLRVKELLDNGFQPLPHPHTMAELFGMLAIACATVQTGRDLEAFEDQRVKWQKHVDRYAELVQRALTLGNYIDSPSLESARALCLLAELYLCCSSSTNRLARGLAILPLAFAALDQLGFHAPESDFAGEETPEEQYTRRALVCALLRLDWQCNYAFGRRGITDPRTWPVEPPVELRDEVLTPEARASPFRTSTVMVHSLKSRFRIARLQQAVLTNVLGKKDADYATVRDYAAKVDALWHEVMLPGWDFYDDPRTGLRQWGDVNQPDRLLTFDEECARAFVVAGMLNLVLTIHRPFVQPELAVNSAAVDSAWHRNTVLTTCRSFMRVYESTYGLIGPFAAIMSTCFDAIIGICLLIFSNSESPEVAKHRYELSIAISHMVKSPAAPTIVIKLGRIATFLLDKPKMRKAEQRAQRENGQADAKRIRKGRMGDGYEPVAFSPVSMPSEYEDFAFSFQPSAGSLSKSPSPVFTPATSPNDDLWHKPSLGPTSIPPSSTYPASKSSPLTLTRPAGWSASPAAALPPVADGKVASEEETGTFPELFAAPSRMPPPWTGGGLASNDGSSSVEQADPLLDPALLSTVGANLARYGGLGTLTYGLGPSNALEDTLTPAAPLWQDAVALDDPKEFDQWFRRLSG